jgi:hypothetical protein
MKDLNEANTGSGGVKNPNDMTIAQAISLFVVVTFICIIFYSIGKIHGEANQRARLVRDGIVKYEVTTNAVVETNKFVVVKP